MTIATSTTKAPRLPWVSLSLLGALLCLTPYAVGFLPFEGSGLAAADPLYTRRVALVGFGLLATVVSFVEVIFLLARRRTAWTGWVPAAALWHACFVIGWRCLPYWVLGVYQVGRSIYPWRDQDPKRLIPMTWIGEFWRIPIVLMELANYLVLPCLLIAVGVAFRRRLFSTAVITFAGAVISAAFVFYFKKDYFSWLMD